MKRLASDEDRGFGQRREVLGLAVPVGMPRIRRPAGNPEREERQQRRDQVGPGVDRLGDEAEAPAREAGTELEPDQHQRGQNRDERCSPLRAHRARL